MGTPSVIHFKERSEYQVRHIASVYQQYDGYPDSVGVTLAEFLSGIKIIHGIGSDARLGTHANGPGCLVAQFIAQNKDRVGGLYMTDEGDSQDYDYTVYFREPDNALVVKVEEITCNKWSGTLAEFVEFCKSGDD